MDTAERSRGRSGKIAAAVSLVAVAGILSGVAWQVFHSAPESGVTAPLELAPAPHDDAPPSALPAPAPTTASALEKPASTTTADDAVRPPPLALSSGMLAWEQQLADAAKGREGTGAARAIFQLLSRFPDEALATAAERAVNVLPDRDYAAVAAPVVVDATTRAQVLAVLFADLMERPDAIALPTLLAIARQPAHPFAEPALENLRLLLRADFARDWQKWEAAVRARTSG